MSKGYCEQVAEFTTLAYDDIPQLPTKLDNTQVRFIAEMVNSEMIELAQANTLTGQVDALLDAIYYIQDCAVKMNVDLDPLFSIVHEANMRKVVDGRLIKDKKGKVCKPEGWYGPEIELTKELKHQYDTRWAEWAKGSDGEA
jgi:predicted HAD superfamily Cof-like phosphohydrolase